MNRIAAFLLFLSCSLSAQKITKGFLHSLSERIPHKGKAYQNIQHLNSWLQLAGEPDTIVYQRSGDTIVYTFRGNEINVDANLNGEKRPIVTWHNGVHGHWLLGCRYTSKKEEEIGLKEEAIVVRIRECNARTKNETVTLENYRNGVLMGRSVKFSRRSLSVLEEGQYRQIDSLWQDTVLHVDPMTYEIVDSLIIRNKYPVKFGEWLYFNEKGDTVKVESHYPK
ncbi:hypothetical protein [Neolewinella agarilytica]|uniref:Uncharacterized protein n=1 Tax=Neolewinella agarilytica TaxID=478744 RepID=A0A1H9GA85_9BACT|nr:hypothetical protein [Neolewinella agarilytica]SEQ46923.1 hypothetical protein SAMN05444359_11099 [Neolewinella agarilytica]